MGTNYYLMRQPTLAEKNELCDLIHSSDNFEDIMHMTHILYGSVDYDYDSGTYRGGRIHLGKRSGGWKFLWNTNWHKLMKGHSVAEPTDEEGVTQYRWVDDGYEIFKFYDLNKKSLKEFIDRPEYILVDEYGEVMDKDEFFKMALEWDGYDIDTYNEAYPGSIWYPDKETYSLFENEGFVLAKAKTEFYSDGLRWATSTDFC